MPLLTSLDEPLTYAASWTSDQPVKSLKPIVPLLAALHLARKPPSLAEAEALLQEALGLKMQIGQRAATLKPSSISDEVSSIPLTAAFLRRSRCTSNFTGRPPFMSMLPQ